jgi:hypothetical protein
MNKAALKAQIKVLTDKLKGGSSAKNGKWNTKLLNIHMKRIFLSTNGHFMSKGANGKYTKIHPRDLRPHWHSNVNGIKRIMHANGNNGGGVWGGARAPAPRNGVPKPNYRRWI